MALVDDNEIRVALCMQLSVDRPASQTARKMTRGDLIVNPERNFLETNQKALFETTESHFLETSSLPPECYKSDEFFQAEIDNIFFKYWLFVGREEKVPTAGDYFVFDLLGESVIVLRNPEGGISAFQNFCRHRGARLLDGEGSVKMIRCPFHNWGYDLDGSLMGAPDMKKSINFAKEKNGLVPIRVETWEGFIFINFDTDAAPLMEFLGDLPDKMHGYQLQKMRCVMEKNHLVKCNWKLYTEVDMEDYHAPTVHPVSIGQQVFPRQPSSGEYETTFFEYPRTVSVTSVDNGKIFPKIPGISGKEATGTYFTMIYPGFFLVTTQDSSWWINKLPETPTTTKVHVGYCFPESTVARDDFKDISPRYISRWDMVIDEDNRICERQQLGVNSRWCLPGRFSFHEEVVHAMNKWVIGKVYARRDEN
ncbi:aromatic ring-hydroxylating oxygenase subunit alpha [Paraburkholderia megapolitana]|uniref:aromatic ring-hydroxylating oxygenase subunit alpha n=1 Tax=Paraburkholderia megapolitana TaxID=420953 RepID=UPI001160AC8E|nr:aromatic ring-hydroxylating dioxygenase subunit alpha [Paraburkholderia megapolitana]QDQ83388.1 aromatic ring-hydroxylating dioxygenase subunit alpha [Paraburkholderia megapolitana]